MILPRGIDKTNARDSKGNIRWAFIDPHLRDCSEAGDLARLAEHLGLHKNTLAARRKSMGLGELPTGRPVKWSPFAGATFDRDTTRPAFSDHELRERIKREREKSPPPGTHAHHIATRCLACTGLGVTPAPRGHHVCDKCSGSGREPEEHNVC